MLEAIPLVLWRGYINSVKVDGEWSKAPKPVLEADLSKPILPVV